MVASFVKCIIPKLYTFENFYQIIAFVNPVFGLVMRFLGGFLCAILQFLRRGLHMCKPCFRVKNEGELNREAGDGAKGGRQEEGMHF
jgi:hypothetical protein